MPVAFHYLSHFSIEANRLSFWRTSDAIDGEPVINWAGSHYHHLGDFLLSLQSRPTLIFLLLLRSPSEFFLSRVVDGICGVKQSHTTLPDSPVGKPSARAEIGSEVIDALGFAALLAKNSGVSSNMDMSVRRRLDWRKSATSFLERCIAHSVLATLSFPTRFFRLAMSLSKAFSRVSYSLPNP